MSSQHLGPRGDSLVGRISMGIVVDISTVTWVYKTSLNMSIIYIYIYLELGEPDCGYGSNLRPKKSQMTWPSSVSAVRSLICQDLAYFLGVPNPFSGHYSIHFLGYKIQFKCGLLDNPRVSNSDTRLPCGMATYADNSSSAGRVTRHSTVRHLV